ncbi:importin subunit alpha-5-like isoform X3 [Daphnia pulex]|nr:importin subunit alpha-5-like isoform X3 [Daphnia pulex]
MTSHFIITNTNLFVIPKLIEFLSRVNNSALQSASIRALAEIGGANADLTKAVVSAGAITKFIYLLDSPHPAVVKRAGSELSVMASYIQELREEIIESLLTLIQPDTSVKLLRSVTYTLENICLNIIDSPPAVLLPALAHLINSNDEQIIVLACKALMHILKRFQQVHQVVDAGVVPRLVELLGYNKVAVIIPTLESIRKIVNGDVVQTKSVLAAGAFTFLGKLLVHPNRVVVQLAAKLVAAIHIQFAA